MWCEKVDYKIECEADKMKVDPMLQYIFYKQIKCMAHKSWRIIFSELDISIEILFFEFTIHNHIMQSFLVGLYYFRYS